jgi:hypothetical protein
MVEASVQSPLDPILALKRLEAGASGSMSGIAPRSASCSGRRKEEWTGFVLGWDASNPEVTIPFARAAKPGRRRDVEDAEARKGTRHRPDRGGREVGETALRVRSPFARDAQDPLAATGSRVVGQVFRSRSRVMEAEIAQPTPLGPAPCPFRQRRPALLDRARAT